MQAPKVVCGYDISSLVVCWRARLHLRTGNLKMAKSSIRTLLTLHPRHTQVDHCSFLTAAQNYSASVRGMSSGAEGCTPI